MKLRKATLSVIFFLFMMLAIGCLIGSVYAHMAEKEPRRYIALRSFPYISPSSSTEPDPVETHKEIPLSLHPLFTRAYIRNALTQMLDDWGEPAFAIDNVLVQHVSYFFKYYLIINAAYFNEVMERSKTYLPYIIRVFKEYRLPEEIAFAIPFVESGFDNSVVSHKDAVGMFQFIRESGELYGLKIAEDTDERKDYQKAAVACARYLRANRNLFASLVLSLGSYHHGTGKVSQVLLTAANADERNFGSLFKNRHLGRYSKEYIPKCLSVALIYRWLRKNPSARIPETEYTDRTLKRSVPVSRLEKEVPHLYELNPDLQDVKKIYLYASNRGYRLVTHMNARGIKTFASMTLSDREEEITMAMHSENLSDSESYWLEEPAVRPSGKISVTGHPKYIRYIFQTENHLDGLAAIFHTTEAAIRNSHENRYLSRRDPRPGDVIRIDGLSPTTQIMGQHLLVCGKPVNFKTAEGETLIQVYQRAMHIIRYACANTKWQMGTDVTPDLIYYWNREVLGNIRPDEPLKGEIPLTVYSDYLWEKALKKR